MENAGDDPLGRNMRRFIITILSVPLLRGRALGAILVRRTEVRPFEQKHISLLTTFADQAAIAIENVRLFEAEQQRTRELSELLEQRTATSKVLQVISSSPGELQPVFQAMLENATRICEATYGVMWLREGDGFRNVAFHGALPEAYTGQWRSGIVTLARIGRSRKLLHVADLRKDRAYLHGHPLTVSAVDVAGVRTSLGVPMFKEDEFDGVISIYRKEVQPFTDKQIALVTTFAAQAVIAIENARLLNELRQRTDDLTERTTDLTEALEQQTATSEVLQVISSSPGDLQPAFEAMLANAVRICDAIFGNIYRWDGNAFSLVATHNTPLAYAEARRRSPVCPNPNNIFGLMVATKAVAHVPDAAEQRERGNWEYATAVELGGVRTCLAAPMLKEHELIGSISLFRQEVRPFTDKQIALITNFAAQAVIAIENARLLNELRQSLEQQTATADVPQVISRSPGDLEPVFATMLENAVRICDAKFGIMNFPEPGGVRPVAMHNVPEAFAELRQRVVHFGPKHPLVFAAMLVNAVRISGAKFGIIHSWDGEYLRLLATYNLPPALEQARKGAPEFKPGPKTGIRRMAATKSAIHIPDLREARRLSSKNLRHRSLPP